jgi:hypothetical protein
MSLYPGPHDCQSVAPPCTALAGASCSLWTHSPKKVLEVPGSGLKRVLPLAPLCHFISLAAFSDNTDAIWGPASATLDPHCPALGTQWPGALIAGPSGCLRPNPAPGRAFQLLSLGLERTWATTAGLPCMGTEAERRHTPILTRAKQSSYDGFGAAMLAFHSYNQLTQQFPPTYHSVSHFKTSCLQWPNQ